MGWLQALFGGQRASQRRVLKVIWRPGSYPMEAVGESHYQDALARICGGHSRHGHEMECRAQIVPEPSNTFDRDALKVVIGKVRVGYVSREHAARLKAEMAQVGFPDAIIEAAAIIRGGWRTNQYDEGMFGVRLGIPTWGPITFEGFSQPPASSPAPAARASRVVALEAEDFAAFEALVARLEEVPLVTEQDAERRRRAFHSAVVSRMLEDGVSSGVAAGAPSHLTQGEEHFRAEMRRMDNLLREQVRIFGAGLDAWFEHGERFPPYYPFRIAVILRKAKRPDLERRFLSAYLRHFRTWTFGGRYSEIVDRAAKLGLA